MNTGIKNKIAFVAGSSAGIGKAVAIGLAQEGCNLMLCARSEEKLRELAANIEKEHGVKASYVAADLDTAEGVEKAGKAAKDTFGGVDILVVNNGGPKPSDFESATEADWVAGWNRTFMSAVRLIGQFLPDMKSKNWGRIINITSIAVKQPVKRLLLSNSYRAGVTGMAKTLSDEVASFGVTVNNIAPGYIATERYTSLLGDRAKQNNRTPNEEKAVQEAAVPAGRIGEPKEVAALAVFLASEGAAYITGTTTQVDGGLYRGLL